MEYFDYPEMAETKESIERIDDGNENVRKDLVQFIDDYNSTDDYDFFYNMIPNIRFMLVHDPNKIAHTCPDTTIWLNAPHPIHSYTNKNWDFIYCHECMHQIWDTFGVGDIIEQEKGWCDRFMLNLASDCVINDFLSAVMKKDAPDSLITPESIKKDFDVEFDRYKDTQYTLYKKMIESKPYQDAKDKYNKELEKWREKYKDEEEGKKGGQQGQGSGGESGSQGGQAGGQQGSGGGNKPKRKPESKEYVDGWNKAIEDYEKGLLKI